MYRSNRDGVTDWVTLRTDTHFGISEILWARDMSLAVIASTGNSPNNQTGILTILPTDGAMPAIKTPFGGYGLQWGQSDQDIEEYAVYNALFEKEFEGDSINQVLIIDRTRVNNSALLEKDLTEFQKNTPLSPELVASFKGRNQQSYPLEPMLDFGLAYQLWSQEEVDVLRQQDEASGWKLFYEKYPNTYGFVYLSRVGFNADFSQALVYISSFHYEQPIKGGYYLMTRKDGRWIIESGYEWIS
jgi:hypothetical protein